MSRREFTSQKALQDHAEQTDKVCVMEGIAIRQRQLSPDQYEIVDVRTSRGVLRSALLIGGRLRRRPRGAGDQA